MICINYLDNKNIRSDIEPLFVSAFPENERPSADYYFASFDGDNKKLFGFYDNDIFVGFASVVLYEDICYIFFLAVDENKRQKGYGSKILDSIKKMYEKYVILLCYEEVDKKYKDYEKRRKREAFYLKNGFINNNLKTNEFGVVFQTVYYGSHQVSFEQYQQIFATGFGEWCIKHLKIVS